jgi:hypothetical protein
VRRGKLGACGRDYRRAQEDTGDIYKEEPILRLLVGEKKTIVDMQAYVIA